MAQRVRALTTSEVTGVYEYLLSHHLYRAAALITFMNEDTARGILKAMLVDADIGGGFIGDDGVIYVQGYYNLDGVGYKMEEIFFHEFLARQGFPHEFNELMTLRFKKKDSIYGLARDEIEIRLSDGKLPSVGGLPDRTMDPNADNPDVGYPLVSITDEELLQSLPVLTVGQRISKIRENRGLKQIDVRKAADLSSSTYCHIENEKTNAPPHPSALFIVCKVLGVDPILILTGMDFSTAVQSIAYPKILTILRYRRGWTQEQLALMLLING